MATAKELQAHRNEIAQSFVHLLEEKGLEWKQGWSGLDMLPRNGVTGAVYNGMNRFQLFMLGLERGYTDPRWVTMNQIMDRGGTYHKGQTWRLQKGSKAVYVEYWYPYDPVERKTLTWAEYRRLSREDREALSMRCRFTPVFHASMVDGMPPLEVERYEPQPLEDLVARLSENMGVEILNDGGDQAFYRPSEDKIHLPAPDRFHTAYDYNATALHELTHATGHSSRLDRPMGGGFGSPEYAYEELVAEIGSCFMGAALGAEQTPEHLENHKAYVQGWIQAIKDKPETLGSAIQDAQKASDYMDKQAGISLAMEQSQTEQVPAARVEVQEQPRYQVVVYHHFENGFDDKLDYGTLADAEAAMRGYLTGTMEQDGFRYEGAAIYDQQAGRYIALEGYFPDEQARQDVFSSLDSLDTAVKLDPNSEPVVTILRSESPELQEGRLMTLSDANRQFFLLDSDRHLARQLPNYAGPWYDKVSFRIDFLMDGKPGSYEGRYDIGDGDGTLLQHIRAAQPGAADTLIPYLELHDGLGAMARECEKVLDAEPRPDPARREYYLAILEYVEKAREAVNHGQYQLPPTPRRENFERPAAAPSYRTFPAGQEAGDAAAVAFQTAQNWPIAWIPAGQAGMEADTWLVYQSEDALPEELKAALPQKDVEPEPVPAAPERPPVTGWQFHGGAVRVDEKAGLIEVKFTEKPAQHIRTAIKEAGYRWMPKLSVWQRALSRDIVERTQSITDRAAAPAERTNGAGRSSGREKEWSPVTKNGKLRFTDEQYKAAAEASALEYARSQGYDLVRKGSSYVMRQHDSMVFSPDGFWNWNSRAMSGKALQFIMEYEHRSLAEAVLILNGIDPNTAEVDRSAANTSRTPYAPRQEDLEAAAAPKEFVLPPRAAQMNRTFGYLCGVRGLDYGLVRALVKEGRIYEGVQALKDGKEAHNVVFVGYDADGAARSASVRGSSEKSSFKMEVPGSDKTHPFVIPGREGADTLYVFESAIDAASHASMQALAGMDWRDANRVGISGNAPVEGILNTLASYPSEKIVFCLDNDQAGQKIFENLRDRLEEHGIAPEAISQAHCPLGKDWNEYLQTWRSTVEHYCEVPTVELADTGRGPCCGRIHYLTAEGKVSRTAAYTDPQRFAREAADRVSSLARCVVETPAQLEQLHRMEERRAARAAPQPEQAPAAVKVQAAEVTPAAQPAPAEPKAQEPGRRVSMKEQLASAAEEANQRNKARRDAMMPSFRQQQEI